VKQKIKQLFRREWNLRPLNKADEAISSFTPTERVIFYVLVTIFVVASFSLLLKVHQEYLTEVPRKGGSLTEGVIGSPRFINPLLAISDADRDLTALVYSGLLKLAPEGHLIHDLAESYDISEDGLTYTVRLKDGILFHDGEEVTADDIIFTIIKAKDPTLKSPKRANWEGVDVSKLDTKTVVFTLSRPYAPFLENLTLGILPKHIWENADTEQFPFSQFNIEPIGSGPYEINKIKRNDSGVPLYYEMKPFEGYTGKNSNIEKLVIRFYTNTESLISAYNSGDIESINSIEPKVAAKLRDQRFRVESTALPRVFGIFFNQNQAQIFADEEVREALNMAVDKEKIVKEVLYGYGTAIDSPLPPGFLNTVNNTQSQSDEDSNNDSVDLTEETGSSTSTPPTKIEMARDILISDGWEINEETGVLEKEEGDNTIQLSFSISTANAPELEQVANMVKSMWEELGAVVEVKTFEQGELNQNVIRARKYEALLFGEVVGRDLDLFAFWHSSQRNDPGLNIALYANITTDKLLAEARETLDKDKRLSLYREFEEEILNDTPAVFLYSPDFLYILPEKVKGFSMNKITIPSERFISLPLWYIDTERVWKVFVSKE